MTRWENAQKDQQIRAERAIGQESLSFFGPDSGLVFRHDYPELVMSEFDDDLSGEDGHR